MSLGFGELAPHAVTVHLGDVTVPVAALDGIVTAKERANRTKDREPLPELRALQARKTAQHRPRHRRCSASSRAPHPGDQPPRRCVVRMSPGVLQRLDDEANLCRTLRDHSVFRSRGMDPQLPWRR